MKNKKEWIEYAQEKLKEVNQKEKKIALQAINHFLNIRKLKHKKIENIIE